MGHRQTQAQVFLLPKDPNKAIEKMLETIDRLSFYVDQETSALAESDTAGFMALQDHKITAARAYQSGVEQLLARKEEIRLADPKLIQILEHEQQEFHARAIKNENEIKRMRSGMDRIRDLVMKTARDVVKRQQQITYGSEGYLKKTDAASMGMSESV